MQLTDARRKNVRSADEIRQLAAMRLNKKEQQALEGQQAMADYEAARRATLENMGRLRELRLARDAATQTPAPPPAKPQSKPSKKL